MCQEPAASLVSEACLGGSILRSAAALLGFWTSVYLVRRWEIHLLSSLAFVRLLSAAARLRNVQKVNRVPKEKGVWLPGVGGEGGTRL